MNDIYENYFIAGNEGVFFATIGTVLFCIVFCLVFACRDLKKQKEEKTK